jgi:hypothetical protein
MPRLVPMRLEKTKEVILIEVDEVPPALEGGQAVAVGPGLTRAASVPGRLAEAGTVTTGNSFDAALRKVKPALESVVEQLRTLAPDAFDVEVGLTMYGDVDFYIAKGGAEANFKVTLHWGPRPGFSTS